MFLTKIFQWIIGLFSAMKKAYNKLSVLERKLSLKASGIIAIINTNLNASPDTIIVLIQQKFPEVSTEMMSAFLTEAGEIANIFHSNTTLKKKKKITTLQKYLSETGNTWVYRSQSLVKALITVMLPSTPLEKVTIVLEYIYQKLVKGKI
mgnify:CR=1 FL=1